MLRSFSLWLVPFSVSGNMTDTTEKEVLANIGDLTLEQLLVVHADLGLPDIDEAKESRMSCSRAGTARTSELVEGRHGSDVRTGRVFLKPHARFPKRPGRV